MAKAPCLPFCHWPSFPEPCNVGCNIELCCVDWTHICGTMNWRHDYFIPQGESFSQQFPFWGGCQGNCSGYLWWGVVYGESTGAAEEDYIGDLYLTIVSPIDAGAYTPSDPADGPYPVDPLPDPLWCPADFPPSVIRNTVGCEECCEWPPGLTSLSGYEDVGWYGEPGSRSRRFPVPSLRWWCTEKHVHFEAGWEVYRISGAGSTRCVYFDGFFSAASGNASTDWATGGTVTLSPSEDLATTETFSTVVSVPTGCNYEPCGDPLDCFASCISGTKDCDGTTPAHVPVIYITFNTNSASCCITGTFAMRWVESVADYGCGGSGGGYTMVDPPTCTVDGCPIRICATLSCGADMSVGGGVVNGPGSNTGILRINVTDGDGCEEYEASYIVGLACSDGVLAESSGTIILGNVCNDTHETDLDWVLHG